MFGGEPVRGEQAWACMGFQAVGLRTMIAAQSMAGRSALLAVTGW